MLGLTKVGRAIIQFFFNYSCSDLSLIGWFNYIKPKWYTKMAEAYKVI